MSDGIAARGGKSRAFWMTCVCFAASASAPSNPTAWAKSVPPPANVAVLSQSGVVASDHPLASAVGAQVLERGGSAADAGVATLLTLGVVNPFASGLGGGGFCLHRSAKDGAISALDFREVAPRKAKRDMYVKKGKAVRALSRVGGLAVGVPGEARGLERLHKLHGKLPWRDVVHPAWEMAHHGFVVGTLLPKRLARKSKDLSTRPAFVKAFGDGEGGWVQAGQVLQRRDIARALQLLRDEGADPFYRGAIAAAIIKAAGAEGGILSKKDLSGYRVSERKPVQGTYRGYEIASMPPPSSGGIAILQALNILEGFDLPKMGEGPESSHLIAEALKHAFADRARHLGDADFVKVPVQALTSKTYAKKLAASIDPKATRKTEAYGSVKPPRDDSGTSHISVIDAAGNMLSCTSTVNTSFGSLVYVPEFGLTLNNEMDDFSAQPGVPNAFGLVGNAQNAIKAGKRPLSSMSPTLVLKDGKPHMIAGGSGGPTIITGTLLALLRVLDFKQTPAQAIRAPRLHHQWLPPRVYAEPTFPGLAGLRDRGHEVKEGPAFNSIQIIVRDPKGGFWGVSDPRKHGRPAAPGKK